MHTTTTTVLGPDDGKAGFERYFEELVDMGGVLDASPQTLAELCARYELEMQPDSIPGLVERFGLRMPGEPI